MAWIGLIIHLRSPLQGVCVVYIIMAALYNRTGRYIFVLWFLLLCSVYLFSLPNLSRRRLDVYHTSTHGVALVRI